MQRNLPPCTVTDPVEFEWDALVNVLEGVLSQILMVTERSSVAGELYLIEELLKYLSNSNDPLILSVLLFCISSLFVFRSMSSCQITAAVSGVQLLPLILDNVASTLKARVVNKAKAAIAAIKDIASTPSPKRKRKINGSGDVSTQSRNIQDPNLKFGFLVLDIMVCGIFKTLLNSGHRRRAQSCYKLQLVFGNCGVISVNLIDKGYVEMTGVAPETSQDIVEEIIFKGGRYLEAQTCFEAISRNSFYLGNVGNATKIYLVLQIIHGVTLAGIAERLKESMMQHVAVAAANVVGSTLRTVSAADLTIHIVLFFVQD
ncbi:chromosome region maintenance protein 5/exportin [Culex quinquefasciatus]|uniref:Chromosome region maintenance protein 5/exportin n=1 Tax=Culex quinquefasciatus TaxID=7176 RepID=B0WIH8_CULQU|nr:chromosome region maintenance protein 5/exportin [Culex quinquefasciatus]|eukprot:XP_001848512.1 chromosome region maintenance protein 5/exportin [Culex quinquefasciatus]